LSGKRGYLHQQLSSLPTSSVHPSYSLDLLTMKLQLAALSLFLAATTIVQAQVDDSGMTEGIQDSVYAFGTNNCQSDANAQDEDIMIDCFDPKTAKKPFTSHQALEYADQVPTMFKSFHGSDAGLNACVVSLFLSVVSEAIYTDLIPTLRLPVLVQ
jgi:hypothetical protein